jgi:hypothetical protein
MIDETVFPQVKKIYRHNVSFGKIRKTFSGRIQYQWKENQQKNI